MDVTSMLNNTASLASAEQTKPLEASKQPPRNRTPWDAGGYSLPIMSSQLPSSGSANQQDEQTHQFDDSRDSPNRSHEEMSGVVVEALKSLSHHIPDTSVEMSNHIRGVQQPQDNITDSTKICRDSIPTGRHQPSDSRSSLSSFASSLSLNSASHSRYSSTSTVSGYQPLGTIADESDLEEKHKAGYPGAGARSPMSYSPIIPHPRAHSVTSAIEPLSTLALIAERRSQENLCTEAADLDKFRRQRAFANGSKTRSLMMGYDFRSASPSDGLLIKRPTHKDLQEPSPKDRKRRLYVPVEQHLVPSRSTDDNTAPRPLHKRTTSAPGIIHGLQEAALSSEVSSSRTVGPQSEPTPPCSSHPEHKSPPSTSFSIAPNTPPDHAVVQSIPEPRCMYIEDCDTNSTPRKAISHLLGRNKMCTRLIPAHIWVQYCRKHYQRARYRNMGGWPPLQCDLVQEQIRRLETWSSENVAKGSGPVVKDWTLALRKREQTRRDRLAKGSHKKSGALDAEDNSDGETEDISPTRGDRSDNPPQAVPDWLLDMVGSGYSNAEISAIFERIHVAIIEKELPNMPDIEILPNIIVDREAPKEAKGYVKRKPMVHQRSRSLGGAALRGSEVWNNSARQGSQPVWDPAPMYGNSSMSPSVKRKRFDDLIEEGEYAQTMPNSQRVRVMHQDISARRAGIPRTYNGWVEAQPQMMHQNQQPHQHQNYQQQMQFLQQQGQRCHPVQGYVDEMHGRNAQYSQQHTPNHAFNQAHGQNVYSSPMMAPQPMRQPYMPTAQQLDSDVSISHRRGVMHQRARSDMTFMRRDDNQYAGNLIGFQHPQQAGFNGAQQNFGLRDTHHHMASAQSGQQLHYQQPQMHHPTQQQQNLPRMEMRDAPQEIRQQQFIDPSAHTWGISDPTTFRR